MKTYKNAHWGHTTVLFQVKAPFSNVTLHLSYRARGHGYCICGSNMSRFL